MSVMAALPPLNPVLARELKQRMRGRHVWLVVTLYLTVLAIILRWVYVTASRDTFNGGLDLLASATAGRAIFQWVLFFMMLLVCFIVPGLTAGAISGERERQTMVALQLTLLRPRSIVAGKLLASLAFVVLLVIASLPLLSVPFLVGGVSLGEVVKGVWMVLATAVMLACLTLACSAVLRRTQAATVVAYGLTLSLVLGTLMIYGAQQFPRSGAGPRPRPWILALNPFAATADVVEGRNETDTFESPFSAFGELLRLSDEDRFSEAVTGSAEIAPNGQVIVRGGSGSGSGFAGPGLAVRPAPAPPAPPFTAPVGPPGGLIGPDGPFIDVDPGFGQFGPVFQEADFDDRVKLGGVRFWVVSLWSWLVLGVAAVILTVRRISLPANREA
jgi:ABC-type transport system involved in multi-copper enzyme maturation permease subunit